MIQTAIYIRVSTEEQAEHGYSIRAQKDKLTYYANIKDWNIVDYYIDEGISGKTIKNRIRLMRMLKDIKQKKINNVLVYKIDRLTRSTKDLIDLIEFFNHQNCDFNSLCESIDTLSATGRMFIKIIGIFAEFERENIIERVKLGLERKVKEGYTLANASLSYGYQKRKGQKVQKPNNKEAQIVLDIYHSFLKGKNYSTIAKELNENHIKTKRNSTWTYKTVKLILTNPNYIGKVRYGINTQKYFENLGKHQAIIDEELFQKVKKKIEKEVKKKKENRAKEDAYLNGYLYDTKNELLRIKRNYYKNICYINYQNKENTFSISQKKVEQNLIKQKIIKLQDSDENKRKKLKQLVDRIIINDDRNIRIVPLFRQKKTN